MLLFINVVPTLSLRYVGYFQNAYLAVNLPPWRFLSEGGTRRKKETNTKTQTCPQMLRKQVLACHVCVCCGGGGLGLVLWELAPSFHPKAGGGHGGLSQVSIP